MKLEYSRQIKKKSSNIKFHQNPSSGSRVVPCGRTDMTKLRVAFRNFSNAPKNVQKCIGLQREAAHWFRSKCVVCVCVDSFRRDSFYGTKNVLCSQAWILKQAETFLSLIKL